MAKGNKTGGRKKGTPNHLSGGVKSNIVAVFDKIGGREAMARWATENMTEFYKLYGRLLPTELSGPEGGAFTIEIVRFAENKDSP
jgi:hypothetical protein